MKGGVVHRLDTATSGLVVIARTKEAYASLQAIQKADLFIKEYQALSQSYKPTLLPGFPPYPYEDPFSAKARKSPSVACSGGMETIERRSGRAR